jgi:hypothetical protein
VYRREAQAYGVAFTTGSVRVEMRRKRNSVKAKLKIKIIMARYRLKADITTYQMLNAIPNQFKSRGFPYGLVEVVKRLKIVAAYADGWNYGCLCLCEIVLEYYCRSM